MMRRRVNTKLVKGGLLVSAIAVSQGCGKKSSDDSTTNDSGISSSTVSLAILPDLNTAMKSSATSLTGMNAVTGTPKKMSELASTDTNSGTCKNWDKYLFNCAVSTINASSSTPSQSQRGVIERGEAICRNVAETANIVREMGGGSMCYMQKMPTLSTTAVKVTKEGAGITAASYADIVKPAATAKLVKIQPQVGGKIQQDIYIDVPAVGGAMTFKLTQCENGTKTSEESIALDVDTGKYTTVNSYSRTDGGFANVMTRTATAYVKKNGDNIEFDLTKDRTVTGSGKFVGSFGTNINAFSISLDKDGYLTNKNYATQSWNAAGAQVAGSGTQKIWAKTLVVGDSGVALKIPEMGMSMQFTQGANSMTPSGAVEWQNDTYADTTTSKLYTEAKAYTFGDDIFKTAPTAPTFAVTATDCTRTPDVIATFVMDSAEGTTTRTKCENDGDGKLKDMYQLCNAESIRSAREKGFLAPKPN